MCVLVGKYFANIGWVGVKNRDRNYTPEISFQVKDKDGMERLLFHDDMTDYKEGFNNHGVSILSASLMVQDDEKEITHKSSKHSPDGRRIQNALLEQSAASAAKKAVKNQLTGNTIIFDKENMFLLEACKRDGKYYFQIKKLQHDETVARSNHGIWLAWAGYQRSATNESGTLSRISSESRLLQAQYVVEKAIDPEDLIDSMCKIYVDHPQLNIMRTDTDRKKMRTTAQEMIIPSERTLYCRPISSHITFDFWKLNHPKSNCWVELLSNRELWQDTKGDPPFGNSRMKHK